MVKNSYKFMFILSLMLGSLIAISSNSWFSMWMGLEINLLSFIPLMMSSKNLFSSESSLKYFLIQAIASAIFLFTIILNLNFMNFSFNINKFSMILISSSMMLKTGAAPFHFWLPSVMEGLNWPSNIILMTWQKIAPLMIIFYCMNNSLLITGIFFCIFFGSLGGLNQTSLRKLMAFSSINHLGWMMAGMMNNENLWLTYYLFYCLLSILIIQLFSNFKLMNLNQTFSLFNSNKLIKFILFINLFSMGGLPPFLGFFPKWLIIETMMLNNNFILLIFMLLMTLITLFFYMRISYSAFLMNHSEMNWNYKLNFSKKNMLTFLILSFISLFGLILINLIFFIL